MKNIARVCGVLIVIAYFLPWMSIMIASINGFTIGKMAITQIGEGGVPLWALPSLLFVVLGIASAVVNNKRGHLASGVYVFLIVIWILVDMAGGTRGSFFEVIDIGLWITLVAANGQIVGAFILFDEMGPKPVTPAWVFTLLRTELVALLMVLATTGIILLFRKNGWEGIWKVTLIGTCGLFAILSVLVIVGGALDVRKLLRRLREREASGESDSGD